MQAQDLLLFQAALGLSDPWRVVGVEFDGGTKRLDLRLDFPRGSTFCCPECDRSGLKARDTEEKTWRRSGFLSAPGVPDGEGAAGALPGITRSGWWRCRGRGSARGSRCSSRRW